MKDKKWVVKSFAILFWILIWQFVYLAVQKEILIVSPLAVLKRFMVYVQEGSFWLIIWFSFLRIFAGVLLGILIGSLFAFLNYFVKWTYHLFFPLLSIAKAAPVVCFILLFLVWVKGNYIPSAIVILMTVPIIWTNMLAGLNSVNRKLLQAAGIYAHDGQHILKYIYIPAVLPYFASGAKLAIGLAWKSGITAEVLCILANSIGGKIYDAKIYLETTDLFTWTVVILIISIIFEKLSIFALDHLIRKERIRI